MYNSEKLRERLYNLGYEVEENCEDILENSLKRAEASIMNTCNCEKIPEELRFVFLDIAAGEYLLSVMLKEDENDSVKSVTEGDLSVSFKDKSEIEKTVDELLNRGREEMLSFRRVKW